MSTDASTVDTIIMERGIVAVLCQLPRQDATRIELLRLLPTYRWHSSDCRVIYEALANWPAEASEIRAALPARITRLGFPDTEIEFCFEVSLLSPVAALASLRAELQRQRSFDALHPESSHQTR